MMLKFRLSCRNLQQLRLLQRANSNILIQRRWNSSSSSNNTSENGSAVNSNTKLESDLEKESETSTNIATDSSNIRSGIFSESSPFARVNSESVDTGSESKVDPTVKDSISEDSTDIDTTPSAYRGVKLPPRPKNYIILNAKISKILPPRRPTFQQPKSTINDDLLKEKLQKLLVFETSVSNEMLLESIQNMKPIGMLVSKKRYRQISNDLLKAYTVPQLRLFVQKNLPNTSLTKLRKKELVATILDEIWGLKQSSEISESSDVIVEHTIQMNSRDLFLILSRNSGLINKWTKNNTRIIITSEQKMVIRAPQNTYEWIQASLANTIASIITKEFDISPLKGIFDMKSLPLREIQQLSNSYAELTGDTLVISALKKQSIDEAERLLWASSGYGPRISNSYLFDTNQENTKRGFMADIIDEGSLSWIERTKSWFRWKFARSRIPKTDEPEYWEKEADIGLADIFEEPKEELQVIPEKKKEDVIVFNKPAPPKFEFISPSHESIPIEPASDKKTILESYTDGISEALVRSFNSTKVEAPIMDENSPSFITMSATFGNLLLEKSLDTPSNNKNDATKWDSLLDNIKASISTKNSAFLTNIPQILEYSHSLPLYQHQTEQPEENETEALKEQDEDVESAEEMLLEELGLDDEKLAHQPDRNIKLAQNPTLETSKSLFKEKSPADLIRNLFDDEDKPIDPVVATDELAHREAKVSDQYAYFVQMKFLPSPFLRDGKSTLSKMTTSSSELNEVAKKDKDFDITKFVEEQFKNYPPMEMWLEIDENEVAINDSVNLVSVVQESNTFVSIPNLNSDVKYSIAKTEFLLEPGSFAMSDNEKSSSSLASVFESEDGIEEEQEQPEEEQEPEQEEQNTEKSILEQVQSQRVAAIKRFLGQSQLNFSGDVRVFNPNSLTLNMPITHPVTGEPIIVPINYLYQSMSYRRQVDLKYKDHILQLAVIEGGVVGGRRIEANLVYHKPSEELAPLLEEGEQKNANEENSLRTFVSDSLRFLDDIQQSTN